LELRGRVGLGSANIKKEKVEKFLTYLLFPFCLSEGLERKIDHASFKNHQWRNFVLGEGLEKERTRERSKGKRGNFLSSFQLNIHCIALT